ncbi:argininosuccinate lyase [Planctomycetota bacterium]
MKNSGKSWQGRIQKDQDRLAVDFVESISIDQRLYKYDIAGSIAHARMLADQKLITRDEFRQIKQALTEIAETIDAGKFRFDKSCEDIHMVIEAALIKKIGPAGEKLHTGRSRNDQVALDMRLWMRDQIIIINDLLLDLQKALLQWAQKQGEIVIPGYTHLQRAQPILTGSLLLAYVEKFHRDRQRLEDAYRRVNICPLGAGALAGSSLPLDRQKTAQLLGFNDITRNSIDSVSDRDFCVEFVFCCAMTAMHLSRLAEDWIIYSCPEFALITIDDAYCTSSSMMPQKRNPDMLELIRGKCGSLYGNLIALLTMLKAQPLAYNRDMQEDKKQIFDAADTLAPALQIAAAIIRNTKFNPDHINRNLQDGFLDATSLAEYLVGKGIPFRRAHQLVAKIVNHCEAKDLTLSQCPLTDFQKICDQIEDDVYDFLGPARVTDRYTTPGAAGKNQLPQQLDFWKEQLNQ